MATEAEIPAPIYETKREESARIEDQATVFPPNKEEKIQPAPLQELPEENFEDDQILGTPSISKISPEANDVSVYSCELAENPGQTVTNDTEISFLRSDKTDDQPLENIATSTNETSSDKLSHNENTSAESIVDATCNKNELQVAESTFLQENDTLLQKDATSVTKPEDSQKVLENTVSDSQVEVRDQSETLEEIAKTHSNLTTTEKTGENLPIQVEDSKMKNDECSEKENDDTKLVQVTTVLDKIKIEEEVTLLKEQTDKPEKLLFAAVEDIKASALGQDTETKNALKDEGFTAQPREILNEKMEEAVNEVLQTEESMVVQNVLAPGSNEEIEDNSMNKVAEKMLKIENITPEENHVKGIQENTEAANSVTTNAELSEEKVRDTCVQKVEVNESSENAKEEAFSFVQSEPSDERNSHEVGADEENPEASKSNDNVTEHDIGNEEVSYDGKAENLLSNPLIETSTDEISLKEVGLDDKTNCAEDLDISAEKLSHKEDVSAETIIDATSNKDEVQDAESSLLQENDTPIQKDATTMTISEDLLENTVIERQEEVQSHSKTLEESYSTATGKNEENSPVKFEECSQKENDNILLTEATRDYIEDDASPVTDNVKFEEEIDLLKEDMVKPEELLHASVNDIKASALGEDTETKCFLKDGSDTEEPREILSDKTEERAADVVAQTEETFEVQNISIAVSNEETEDDLKAVDNSRVNHEECFEKESTESSTTKAVLKDDSIHELNVESEENGLMNIEAQTEEHGESFQDASEDIKAAVSSQHIETTISPEQNLRAECQENLYDQIDNQTIQKDKAVEVVKEETLEIQNMAKTGDNSVIQVDGSEMEAEEHFKDSEKPSSTEICNRDAIENEGLIRSELLVNKEHKESILLIEEEQKERPVESLHVAHEDINTFALSQDDGTKNSFKDQAPENISTEENHVKGIQENAEAANSVTTNAELSEDNFRDTCVQNVEVKESSENAKEKSEPSDENSHEVGEDEVNPEASKPNDNVTEHDVVNEEVSYDDKAVRLPVPNNSGTGVSENLLCSPLIDNSTDEISSREFGLDGKTNYAEDLDIPSEKLSHKEDHSAETIIDAKSNKVEECMEKENDNISLTEATRDYINDDASTVTHKAKIEGEIALLKEETVKPEESLHAAVDDNKTSDLGEEIETECLIKDGSNIEEPREILINETEERNADVVFPKEETYEVQNISIAVSNEKTENKSKTEVVDDSQLKHEDCIEKESTESSTSEAPLKDDSIHELIKNKENALPKVEAQTEKHVESLQDASEDIKVDVSSQDIETTISHEQNLRADPQENLDDQIENRTMGVEKDETLENIARAEENSVIQVNDSEAELEEHINDSEKPSFTETSNRDVIEDEGLRRSVLLEDEKNKQSTLLTEEAQEERPVESLHVAHEDIKAFAMSPCIDDKAVESLQAQSAATFVPSEDAEENSSIEYSSPMGHVAKDSEKTSLTNADLPEIMYEAEIGDEDLQKDELFCSEKNVESTLLKTEVQMEEPTEHLQQAPEAIEPSNSTQDLDTTCTLAGERLNANQQELLSERAADEIDKKEGTVQDVSTATSSEKTEGNSLISDAELIVSHEPKVESKSDLCENMLLEVEAETEKSVETVCMTHEDIKESVSSQNMDGTYPVKEQTLNAHPNRTLDQKIEDITMGTAEIKETPSENVATFANKETREDALIQVDGSQYKQEEQFKDKIVHQNTIKTFIDDDKPFITDKLKNEDEDLSRAELFQNEGTRDCTLIKEESQKEKPVESSHSAHEDYNSLENEAQDEKSIEYVHVDPKDALSQNEEIEKEIVDELEPVESLHALEDDKPLGQDIEVGKEENNDKPLTEDREVEKKEVEMAKPIESFPVLDDDKSLSQTIQVAKEEEKADATRGDDNKVCQDMEVTRNEIKEEDKHVAALHVDSEDKALGQDNEVVKEETDEKIITASMHVVHVEDKALSQVAGVANEEAEENKPSDSLHEAYENDNSLSQDTKIAKEEEEEEERKYVMSLPVACEEENSLSQDSEIAKAETEEETSAKSLDVASEDDKALSHKTEVTEKENLVETLSVAPEDEAVTIVKDEAIEEKPILTLHVAPDHDIPLCQDMEVVRKERDYGKPSESLHGVPKDDEALSQDKEVINQKAEEKHLESVFVGEEMERVKEEVDEQNHVGSFDVSLEKDNESSQDTTAANEDAAEQHTEPSHIAHKNDSDDTPTKEKEDNIVESNQTLEHQRKKMKEEVDDVVCQLKMQDEPETTKKDSRADLQVTDNQHNATPHLIDTEVTTHDSVGNVQETTELEGKSTCDNIGNVNDGGKIADSNEKEKTITEIPIQEVQEIYQQSEGHAHSSTQIIQEGSEEMTKFVDNSAKEVVPCEEAKKIMELDTEVPGNIENVDYNAETTEIIKKEGDLKNLQTITAVNIVNHEEKGIDAQYIANPETEGSDATEEVVVNISKDSNCNEKEFSSTEVSEEAQISHEKSLDVTSLVSEASEEKGDHKSVGAIVCTESTELKEMKVLENESTTISTKENVELCGESTQASDITQEMPKLEGASQAAVNEITLENKELTSKEIANNFLPRETALLEDYSTTEREPHIGKMEALENEEAKTEKDEEEEVSEHKNSECSSGTPIMTEAKGKDLSELGDEENTFQDIDTIDIMKDEDGLSYNAIKVKASDISESKEILVPESLEEVLDSVTQVQNCNVISETEEAKLEEKKFEAAPAEIKSDETVSEEKPKAATYEATETIADTSREKVHEEDQDTENNHIGSCEEEIIHGSCQENEANQGEEEFEFIIKPYENKEVGQTAKDSNIEFLEDKDNEAIADSIDPPVVNAAGQELQEKLNEDAVHEAEKSEKEAGDDTLGRLTEDDNERTCIEAAKLEIPVDKQVELEVEYTEKVNPDSSICDKNVLVSESKDSKESSSLAEAETLKPSKQEQEEFNCGNDERLSKETTEAIEKSESVEVHTPSLLDLLHKVSAKETPTPMAAKFTTEKEPAIHGEELNPENSHEVEREKSKTDEEKDDEEESGEHHKSDSSSEAPVMVEAGDAEVKVAHKKSHNLLSGVGSKVKHSIAKVKKAITGKSTHAKPTSPK